MYADTNQIRRDVAKLVRPAPRQTIPESASKFVKVKGGKFYDPQFTHYMLEPAECITSREYEATVFVGPAQAGKSLGLVDNTIAHVVTTDPQDVMIIQTSKDQARDFSMRRVDRMHRDSPDVGKHLAPGDNADNTFDKIYRSGMILSLAWPSKNITAGKALPIVIVTDYDRIKDDAGGEGSLFDVLLPRIRTFKTRGMVVAESSPSREVLQPDWKPETPHAAPPTKGILGLFGYGDKRRHYCQCQHCGEYWMPNPGPEGMHIPKDGTLDERLAQIGLPCTACGSINGLEHEITIKESFTWVKEGQTIDRDGVVSGIVRRNKIASFWMPGFAAKYETWTGLAEKLIRAESQYARTKEEESLEAVINTGFGAPYLRKAMKSERTSQDLMDRAATADARQPQSKGVLPVGARTVIITIDNQKHSFVVQAHAFGVDDQMWIIDRYSITVSESRTDDDGKPIVIAPASYARDFDVLEKAVLDVSYFTEDGREIKPHRIGQDLHGEKGVTNNVYKFWRKMRAKGYADKYKLVRGGSVKTAPLYAEHIPDQTAPGKKAKIKGDVPVYTLNTMKLKDNVAALLEQDKPGEGHIHLPVWAEDSWFDEMVSEVRDEKGWQKVSNRNEAWDLIVYALAIWHTIDGHKIDWNDPPEWAADWDENSNVVGSKRKKSNVIEFFEDDSDGDDEDSWLN